VTSFSLSQPPFSLWRHFHCDVICYGAGHAHLYGRTDVLPRLIDKDCSACLSWDVSLQMTIYIYYPEVEWKKYWNSTKMPYTVQSRKVSKLFFVFFLLILDPWNICDLYVHHQSRRSLPTVQISQEILSQLNTDRAVNNWHTVDMINWCFTCWIGSLAHHRHKHSRLTCQVCHFFKFYELFTVAFMTVLFCILL